jgi:TolB protein
MKLFSLIFLFFIFTSCSDDEVVNNQEPPPPSGISLVDYEPAWSPDGHTIAYFHIDTSSSTTGIFLIDTNGTNKRQLVSGYCGSPDFSSDGNWVVFHSGQIYKIKINGDSLTQLTNGENSFYPALSSNGEQIIYDYSNGSINKINFTGENLRILCVCGRMANWSPNNKNIVLISYANNYTPSEIYYMDSSGNNLTRITYNNNWDRYPKISPDGTNILFTQQREASVNFQLFTVNIDGSGIQRITDTQGYSGDYSPDGQKIVYCDSSPGNGRLWIMNKDGTNKRQLTF